MQMLIFGHSVSKENKGSIIAVMHFIIKIWVAMKYWGKYKNFYDVIQVSNSTKSSIKSNTLAYIRAEIKRFDDNIFI